MDQPSSLAELGRLMKLEEQQEAEAKREAAKKTKKKPLDLRGDGTLLKHVVKAAGQVSMAADKRQNPEWGDWVGVQVATLTSKERHTFFVGEARSDRCPGDLYSEMVCTMQLGEIAAFKFGDTKVIVELVEWRQSCVPEGGKEVQRFEVAEGSAWKVVWREGASPWLTPNDRCDVAYKQTQPRLCSRPTRLEGDDDDYEDAFPEADALFVEPFDWNELGLLRVSGPDTPGVVRTALLSMAKNERSTVYRRDRDFVLHSWDVEMTGWVERENVAPGVVKRALVPAPRKEWDTPSPLDSVSVRRVSPIPFPPPSVVDRSGPVVEYAVDDDVANTDVDAGILCMRRGEIARIVTPTGEHFVELVGFTRKDLTADDRRRSGNDAFKRRDFARALRRYKEAMTLVDDRSALYSNAAACYLELGDFRSALQACDTVLAGDPENGQALRRKAKAHVGLGELSEALVPLKRCLQTDPSNVHARQQAQDLKSRLQARKAKARRAFGEALQTHHDARVVSNPNTSSTPAPSTDDTAPPPRRVDDDDVDVINLPNRPKREAARRAAAGPSSSSPASQDDAHAYEDFETFW